ncbi:hypothetical protein [Bradyrhizobium brasilense]|uniref:Transposase n=1 Tax=Bradyrhizobium brasilense TaxID=1419277 RepID=A0ABY8JSM7_9BRAD|nr:hypothetical protein [Bradyrhizobium brasilense]WFU66717.1 hypothetical protein QA636_14910 [Bradyrhizobium brasilense]
MVTIQPTPPLKRTAVQRANGSHFESRLLELEHLHGSNRWLHLGDIFGRRRNLDPHRSNFDAKRVNF